MSRIVVMKILFLFIALAIAQNIYSQNYSAEYQFTFKPATMPDDISSPGILPSMLDIEIIGTYFIKTNGKYMEVTGVVNSITSNGISSEYDEEIVYFDLVNDLVFDAGDSTYMKLVKYKISDQVIKSDSCNTLMVDGFSSEYRVCVCNSIPPEILPGVCFQNLNNGVTHISAPDFQIELKKWGFIEDEMDLEKYFEKVKKHKIVDEFTFFK